MNSFDTAYNSADAFFSTSLHQTPGTIPLTSKSTKVDEAENKLEMLNYWRQTRAHYISANAVLIGMLEGFLDRKTKKGIFANRNFDFISRAVVSAIDEEDWMRFVRLKLELRNDEINEICLKFEKRASN